MEHRIIWKIVFIHFACSVLSLPGIGHHNNNSVLGPKEKDDHIFWCLLSANSTSPLQKSPNLPQTKAKGAISSNLKFRIMKILPQKRIGHRGAKMHRASYWLNYSKTDLATDLSMANGL